MKIYQITTTLSYGDAVSNDILAIQKVLTEAGYQNEIYAENISPKVQEGVAKQIKDLPRIREKDVLLYHLSIGTPLNYMMAELGGKKVVVYHNVTPPHFFEEYDHASVENTKQGLKGASFLANHACYAIADSAFNRNDLKNMGYQCPIDVCPILIPFADYDQKPNEKVLQQYKDDGYTNLLFVGRVAPNKKQENVIRAFYHYHKHYNPKSRLFLVGNWGGMEVYYNRLVSYIDKLDLSDDVIFPGHIKFDEILSYYRLADVFVCMSEHEGFCVPLVEAMKFSVPIVAYDTTAVGETLGAGGLLLDNNSPEYVSAAIHRVVSDDSLKTVILEGQKARLKDFQYEQIRKQIIGIIKRIEGM